jgi:UDP-glucose 4-epimerase
MRLLVIGGAGFVGRHVVEAVGELGEVDILEHPSAYPDREGLLRVDIGDLEALNGALSGYDAVIHLAAVFSREGFTPTDEQLFDVNVRGTFNVLQACVRNQVSRLVMASSICAFGTDPDDLPAREEHRAKPGGKGSAMYGATKYLDERLCQTVANLYSLSTVCLRLAVVKDLTVGTGVPPSAWTLWSYVDVRDVAQAFRLACAAEGLAHEVFFISAADTLSPESNAVLIARDLGHIPRGNISTDWLQNEHASFYAIDKASRMLGYQPQYSWRG